MMSGGLIESPNLYLFSKGGAVLCAIAAYFNLGARSAVKEVEEANAQARKLAEDLEDKKED